MRGMCDIQIHYSNSLEPSNWLKSYELTGNFLLELTFFILDLGFI